MTLCRHEAQLDRIERKLSLLIGLMGGLGQGEARMSMQLQELIDQVTAISDAKVAAVALIQNLADQFAQFSADQAKVDQLAARLKDVAQELGAAVVANTPAGT